nr:COX assembly mitochondrial protein 2 homolog [Tanacetum cinerariifolium]
MHPPLTLHRHPMCAEIIELFQKCHNDHPYGKFFGECTDLKIKLDKCFRQEKAVKRKANFEESKKLKERLQSLRKEAAETENIIELFQKCHNDHPYGKFFGECTDLKIKLDKCFRQEKAVKRKANFEENLAHQVIAEFNTVEQKCAGRPIALTTIFLTSSLAQMLHTSTSQHGTIL